MGEGVAHDGAPLGGRRNITESIGLGTRAAALTSYRGAVMHQPHVMTQLVRESHVVAVVR